MQLEQNIPVITIFLSCTVSVVLIFTYVKFKDITSSLEEISEIFDQVIKGNLTTKVKTKRRNEIYKFSQKINKMIISLQDRNKKIQKFQAELKGQYEYLNALFNSLADGIIITSKDGVIKNINPTIALWSGQPEEEIIEKNINEILKCNCSINCINSNDFAEICPLILQSERFSPTEATITNIETDTQKSLSLGVSIVTGLKGEQDYIIVLRDITESKELEKMREDFTATLTHDLKVPILAASNTLNLFLKGFLGELKEKQKEAISNIVESNNGLIKFVNGLLDVYKYDSVEINLKKQDINLKDLILECIEDIKPLANKNELAIINKANINQALRIDEEQVKRVILNLLDNAINFTPQKGKIVISAKTGENEVIVSITDTGKGISAEDIGKIFDRYYSKSFKFRKVGTGLGLYLSKKIIEHHSGKIWVESELEKGSTFYFSLPL